MRAVFSEKECVRKITKYAEQIGLAFESFTKLKMIPFKVIYARIISSQHEICKQNCYSRLSQLPCLTYNMNHQITQPPGSRSVSIIIKAAARPVWFIMDGVPARAVTPAVRQR